MLRLIITSIFTGIILLVSYFSAPINACQKPTEILFISASHYYPEEVSDTEFQEAIKEIVDFEPELFFAESLPTHDTLGMKEGSEMILRIHAKLNAGIPTIPHQLIARQLQHDPNNLKLRSQLVISYIQQYDHVNSDYQAYQLFKQLDSLTLQKRQAIESYISTNFMSVDTLRKYCRVGKRNEYNKIAFPVMDQLAISTFDHMDNQANAQKFDQAWKDCKDGYYHLVNTAIGNLKDLFEEECAKQNSKIKYENSDFFDLGDYFTYAVPKKYSQNKEAAQKYEQYWDIRNQNMVANIDSVLQQKTVSKAAIIVGAAHARLMKQYLREKGYIVTPLFNGEMDEALKDYYPQLEEFKLLFN